MNFLYQGFQKLKHCRQANRHTDRRDQRHYHAHTAFRGVIYKHENNSTEWYNTNVLISYRDVRVGKCRHKIAKHVTYPPSFDE